MLAPHLCAVLNGLGYLMILLMYGSIGGNKFKELKAARASGAV